MRQSNIELLRVVAMIMVLGLHTFRAPEVITLGTLNSRVAFDFFKESACISAVNLFVLISGYFGIKWKLKSFSSLVFQLVFFNLFGWAVCAVLDYKAVSLDALGLGWFTGWWFTTIYLGLYLIAPVLNAFVEKITPWQLSYFLFAFYVYQTVSQQWVSNSFDAGYSIMSFFGLYLTGRLLSVIDLKRFKWFRTDKLLVLWGGTTLLIGVEVLLYAILRHRGGTEIQGSVFGMTYNNPLVILQSVICFCIFLTLRFTNKIVNWFACSALSIYLLHMHPGWKQELYGLAESLYAYSFFTHYALLMLLIIGIVVVSVLIDKIRIWCFECIYTKLDKYLQNKTVK